MSHSYEEIRSVALDLLSGRETTSYSLTQYENIKLSVASVFSKREGNPPQSISSHLDHNDSELFLEVFWELFRQGILTLGSNDSNRDFPHCRVSALGEKILSNQQSYFFHDVTSYKNLIQKEIPKIDPTTLTYLQEAMQAFKSGCILSSSVMLGVATEHTFLLMLETIAENPKHSTMYKAALNERLLLRKANYFKVVLDKNSSTLPYDIKEDLDTNFAGILSIIRTFRNESGHPTGKIIDREQMYVLLNLFIPYCKKLYALKDFFEKP